MLVSPSRAGLGIVNFGLPGQTKPAATVRVVPFRLTALPGSIRIGRAVSPHLLAR
jgi:hypothetical protein